MREDIYGGLKNALERGATVEQAIQSMVNAGYNVSEVREVAGQISSAENSILESKPIVESSKLSTTLSTASVPTEKPAEKQKQFKQLSNQQTNFKQIGKKKNLAKIILLIAILLVLAGILLITILFKDKIIGFLTNLF